MTILLANLVLAHIVSGPVSWSLPDEYLMLSLTAILFHFAAACLPWCMWRWYRDTPHAVFRTLVQALLSCGFVFAFWWP